MRPTPWLAVLLLPWLTLCAGAGSPSVVPLLQEPFTSVEDAESRLAALEDALLESGDHRAVFVTVYRIMTQAILDHLDAGFFLGADWSSGLTVTFADQYRRAFLDYEQGRIESVPEAWRIAFDVAASGDDDILRHAILGTNAHVNHDLAIAVHQLGIDPNRLIHYVDFSLVNIVLRRATDDIQDALVSTYDPALADLDEALGRLDEILANHILAQWRARAWRVATVLTRVSNPEVTDAVLEWLDVSSGRFARVFAGPAADAH